MAVSLAHAFADRPELVPMTRACLKSPFASHSLPDPATPQSEHFVNVAACRKKMNTRPSVPSRGFGRGDKAQVLAHQTYYHERRYHI
jgi:hypothetical protein